MPLPSGHLVQVISNSGFNPRFTWQVGMNTNSYLPESLRFRATVRPLSLFQQYSRLPSPYVIYEETGISLNTASGIGYWEFPLTGNIATPGGPHRSYQVVIEAHDSNGNTSAGNMVNTTGEAGWIPYSNGYDIIGINNLRFSGVDMSMSVPTETYLGTGYISGSGTHRSYQYFTSDGNLSIEITSGILDDNLVGGYLYVSTGKFPKYETLLRSGEWGTNVHRSQFNFNPTSRTIFAPNAAVNMRNSPYGYASISFYDKLDKEFINRGVDVSTGLALSNNFIVINNSYFSSQSGPGSIYMKRVTGAATGISDPIVTSGLSDGEILVDYVIVGNKTNILYMTETYNAPPIFTGIPELPNLLVGGSVSGIEVSAMDYYVEASHAFDTPITLYNTVAYYHPDITSPPFQDLISNTQSYHNLKASGDSYGISMSGGGYLSINFNAGAGQTWNIVATVNTTYVNGQQSTHTETFTHDFGPESYIYNVSLMSASSGGMSSSPIISNIMAHQTYLGS